MKGFKALGAVVGLSVLLTSTIILGARTNQETKLVPIKDEAELVRLLTDKKILVEPETLSEYEVLRGLENTVPNTQDIVANDQTSDMKSATSEGGYSETNIQEQGVDEDDVLKNDDRYIYKLVDHSKIMIMDTQPSLHIIGKIESDRVQFNSMFLEGNQLIVIGSEGRRYEPREIPITLENGEVVNQIARQYTNISIYDVSNKKEPRLKREIAVQGNKHTMRKIEDKLYLVTESMIMRKANNAYTKEDILPAYKDSLQGEELQLAKPNQIYDVPWAQTRYMLNTTVLTTIDLKQSKPIELKMLLGAIGNVYMDKEAMFLEIYGGYSTISRFNVEGQSLKYVGTGVIEGRLYNQFAMDLYDNYLRVATTSYNQQTYETINNLFIFDKQMNQVSSLTGLAPTERIYSARFEGKTGYLVTYKQMDPLFVLDLSNPKEPKVKGQLKIPGVSTYLHPIAENLVVGIGIATMDEEEGGSQYSNASALQAGIKLSLFDVSNPNEPKEVNKIILGTRGSYSSAQYNHKAVTVHKGKAMLAIPVTIIYNKEKNLENFYGAYVFAVENGKLVGKAKLGRLTNSYGYYYGYNEDRVCYIGNKLYYLYEDKINEYEISNFKRLQTLTMQ